MAAKGLSSAASGHGSESGGSVIPSRLQMVLASSLRSPHGAPSDAGSQDLESRSGGANSSRATDDGLVLVADVKGSQPRHGFFRCVRCCRHQPVSMADKNKVDTCKLDLASYSGLARRWGTNRALKVWWESMTPEARVTWYCKQQDNPTGTKRRYDALTYTDTGSDVSFKHNQAEVMGIPYRVFFREQSQMGQNPQQIEREWQKRIEDPTSGAVFKFSQWLLPQFEGIRLVMGDGVTQSSSVARSTELATHAQMQSLQSAGEKVRNSFDESALATFTIGQQTLNAPHIHLDQSDSASFKTATNVLSLACARDVRAWWK